MYEMLGLVHIERNKSLPIRVLILAATIGYGRVGSRIDSRQVHGGFRRIAIAHVVINQQNFYVRCLVHPQLPGH